MLRQATQNLITALYIEIVHEDELQGETIPFQPETDFGSLRQTEQLYQSALVHRRQYSGANFQRPFSSMLADIEAGKSAPS